MARFEDYTSDTEVRDMMDRLVARFPVVFDEFNTDDVHFITTKNKESKVPVKIHPCRYPHEVFMGRKPYIVETFEKPWLELTPKQRSLSVLHVMCAVPIGGFDTHSSNYGKKARPDFNMYRWEFKASGGHPEWMEDDALAQDPMEFEDMSGPLIDEPRNPVSVGDILSVEDS